MNSSNTQQTPTPSPSTPHRTSRVVNLLAVLLVALLVVAIGLGIMYMRYVKQAENTQSMLMAEKDSIALNLRGVLKEYDMLKTDNADLNAQLEQEKARGEKLLKEIKEVKQVSYDKLKQYQKELGTLRAIMRQMVVEIDSLNTLNQSLVEENTKVRTVYVESQRNIEALTSERDSLSAAVSKGSELVVRNVACAALNRRDKETSRARATSKLKVCFTLMENSIAAAGPRQLYLCITGPDGALLANAEGSTFQAGEEKLVYSATREVDYQKMDMDVCVFYGALDKYTKGDYSVKIYVGDQLAGEALLHLK